MSARDSYAARFATFRWNIPVRCNIAAECCDRWADGRGRPALIALHEDGAVERISFDALHRRT